MAKKQDKIIGFIILAVFVVFFGGTVFFVLQLGVPGDTSISGSGDKIAIVELENVIYSSRSIVRQFERYQKDKSIKAIVFRIESPGGGIAASQEIYEHVRRVRDSGKPVIASMGSVAASGGYYVALGADSIMAIPGTATGSIGVIATFPNYSKLMQKLGIEMTVVKSGRFKDTGSPYRAPTAKDKQYLQAWIDSGYEQFVGAVAREREMTIDEVKRLADGRVFSGEQAYNNGLIDTLGTYEDAIDLAAKAAGIEGEPRIVRQVKKKVTTFDLLFSYDLKKLVSQHVSAWPKVHYLMSY